jgi:DNA repair photolyase
MRSRKTPGGAHAARPASGTGEWAQHNTNIVKGCFNGCYYCYAQAMGMRFGHKKPGTWREEVIRHDLVGKKYCCREGRIMFPTSHDITPYTLDACATVLGKLLAAGNELLIVSKPNPACIDALCSELKTYRAQITFRFTIGSADDTVLKLWEPGAPSFHDRLAALELAFQAGFATSVSCEPMLDDRVKDVIAAVDPFVTDTIWLGKANRLRSTLSLNRAPQRVVEAANALLATQTDDRVLALYAELKERPKIRWKESIKDVVGLARAYAKGLDRQFYGRLADVGPAGEWKV